MTTFSQCLFVAIIFILVTTISTINVPFKSVTAKKCPTGGVGICVTNGTDYILFANECHLQEAQEKKIFERAVLKRITMGFCLTNCSLICSTNYEPVCAIDAASNEQRTFNNHCEMSRDSCLNRIDWNFQNNGACNSNPNRKNLLFDGRKNRNLQPIPCAGIYNPVCAIFRGVKSTFSSECLVNAENVKTGKNWLIYSTGVCAEDHNINEKRSSNIIRSFNEKSSSTANHMPNDGTNYIFPPTIYQTQIIDDAPYNGHIQDALGRAATTTAAGALNIQQQSVGHIATPGTVTHGQAPQAARKTIHVVDANENYDKVSICSFGSKPLCGTYNDRFRSFDNVCELMLRNLVLKQNWTIAYAGKCQNCPQVCNTAYKPICVTKNGKNYTLANECFLKSNICQDRKSEWLVIGPGECQRTQETTASTSVAFNKTTKSILNFSSKSTQIMAATTTTTISPTTTTAFGSSSSTTDSTPPIETTSPRATSSSTRTYTIKSTTTTTTASPSTTITTPPVIITKTDAVTQKVTATASQRKSHRKSKSKPISRFVVSAKKLAEKSTQQHSSVFGTRKDSVIMRMMRAKGFAKPSSKLL